MVAVGRVPECSSGEEGLLCGLLWRGRYGEGKEEKKTVNTAVWQRQWKGEGRCGWEEGTFLHR